MDTLYVVPYNAVLSKLMNCHINVENCAEFKAIQYVFKYQMKGTDQATISTGIDDNNRDEVTTYQNKR